MNEKYCACNSKKKKVRFLRPRKEIFFDQKKSKNLTYQQSRIDLQLSLSQDTKTGIFRDLQLQQANAEQRQSVDEIAQFQNAEYIGSTRSVWRILEHPLSEHYPPVVGLAVHLENG